MALITKLRSAYGRLLEIFGYAAGGILFLTMALIVANVIARYVFNSPIAGTLELTESSLPLIIFLTLADTQAHGGHIKVVLLTQRLSPRGQRIALVVAMALGAVFFAWAAWGGWNLAMKSYAFAELERGSIQFPIWPVRFTVCVGLAALSLQFLLDALLVAGGGMIHEEQGQVE